MAVLLLIPATSWSAYPGTNGLIAYEGSGAQSHEIFAVPPQGGEPNQLTSNSVPDRNPSWSADGKRITFVREGAAHSKIWVMGADGSNQRSVTRSRPYANPRFSPGGRKIVFAGDHALFTVQVDGAHRERLRWGNLSSPGYSPNGRRIVFSGYPHNREVSGIWTVRRDGSHLRRLTRPPKDGAALDLYPDWRPDGHRIAFVRCIDYDPRFACSGTIYSIRPDGAERRRIYFSHHPPIYSPAGDRIALFFWETETSFPDVAIICADLYTIAATGSDPQDVTHNCDNEPPSGFAAWPSWQPIPGP